MTERRKLSHSPYHAPTRVVIHNSLASNLQQHQSPFHAVVATSTGISTSPSSAPVNAMSNLSTGNSKGSSNPNPCLPPSPSGSSSSGAGSSPRPQPSAASQERSRSGSSHGAREMVYVDSKERLSEMVTNIRGISNSLANVALAVAVENVLIVSKLSDDELPPRAREMVEWLLKWDPNAEESLKPSDSRLEINVSNKSGRSANTDAGSDSGRDRHRKRRYSQHCSTKRLTVLVEEEFAQEPAFGLEKMRDTLDESEFNRLKFWTPESPPEAENIDLVITLGGDGTVLYTSWLFQKMVPPTISFGLGSLGFMTENRFEDFREILDEHLNLGICCALRMRFECTVMRTKNQEKNDSSDLENEMRVAGREHHLTTHIRDGEYTILNEVVVDRGPNPFVTMTELYGNFELLTSIKADGVVISTPTGSTAYSMSAGGSLVHPDIPARLISPICPHTLSFRPLVVPDSMVLHIGVPYDARSSAFVSFDGKARVELRRGDFLAINASPYPFPKVLPPQNSSVTWVQQLSRTLHWNEQKRPKRYTDGSSDNIN